MLLSSLLLSLATLATALPSPAPESSEEPTDPIVSNVTVFQPPSDYTIPRTLYARTLQTQDGTLLATWENYGPNNNTFPYFPIYQSTDGGATWSERSKVKDTQNGWGLRYQPFLYELSEPLGSYPAGTILLSGSSIPDDLSQTQIELYASCDCGYTWEFVSHVARGGRAIPNNGETPVWEPFLMVYNHSLIIYYSDQRDPKYGQKLVHQVTSDLVNFGPVVDDVAYGTYDWRPGMTTVSKLPNGNYILTYEFYGAVEADFAVYYRLSPDPLAFNSAVGHVITATDGTQPSGSPYNVWTPVGGVNGTIFVSAGSNSTVFANRDLAEPGSDWIEIETPEGTSYTRSLLIEKDEKILLIVGGGVLNGSANRVSASEMDISAI